MTIQTGTASRRGVEAGMLGGGWAATVAVFAVLREHGAGGRPGPWLWPTVMVAVVAGALATLVAVEAVRARRGGTWQVEHRIPAIHVVGVGLSWVAFLLSGLWAFGVYFFAVRHACDDTAGGSFECSNRAGPGLAALGVLVSLAPIAVLLLAVRAGRCSRVVAWLAPVAIVLLFLLAICLWMPHTGPGVPDRKAHAVADLHVGGLPRT